MFLNSISPRKIAIVCCLVAAAALMPARGNSQELGLTPSHVVSLWTNINAALVTTAQITAKGDGWDAEVKAMNKNSYSGKKPADVLNQVSMFRDRLDRLRAATGLKKARRHQRKAKGKITPSDVFLNSGYVLDGMVDWLVRNTGKSQLVSQFYTRHKLGGMKPSDAFAMVELATRRIDVILARKG